ncbi:MAG: C-GCAxxG-C-C family protein [Verrucomicrobia bacterium]|nr:C-GCAxxG-C-C family protein [Verrucomicrobiota bacterium]
MKPHSNRQQPADGQPPRAADLTTLHRQKSTQNLSRRRFLAETPKLLAGATVGAGVLGMAPGSEVGTRAQTAPEFPWPYTALDPDLAAERAYAAYYSKGCMYGVFEGILGELREKVGYPFTVFPTAMMEYGKGGVNGVWGTLCGTLNGAAAAINLVSNAPAPVINELFFWYGQEPLPNYRPQTPKYEIGVSVSASPICHTSVQRWCEVAGFAPTSPERKERCGWLTGAVAKYTVEQLNKQAAGTFASTHQLPAEVQRCMGCHAGVAPQKVEHGKNMSCAQCHTGIDALHPQKHVQIRWTGSGTLEQADAVTGPWGPAASQSNPLPLPLTDPVKFFRLK